MRRAENLSLLSKRETVSLCISRLLYEEEQPSPGGSSLRIMELKLFWHNGQLSIENS